MAIVIKDLALSQTRLIRPILYMPYLVVYRNLFSLKYTGLYRIMQDLQDCTGLYRIYRIIQDQGEGGRFTENLKLTNLSPATCPLKT